jgi:predicted dinucleotide-utilizing enzyme
MNVSIIGSGNLAWHLAPALDNVGFVVKEVYSRNPQHTESLTDRLYQAEVKATLDFSTSDSSLFIIAVSDDAIKSIAQEIILPDEAISIRSKLSASKKKLILKILPSSSKATMKKRKRH